MLVSCVGVVVLLGLAASFMTATASAHRRAQSGADLAALAGAGTLQRGDEACAAAGRVATANAAVLVTCRVIGEDVMVEVRVPGPEFLGHTFEIRGRSRAGPQGVG
ncbi:flp pilus-assembly TadE/G-like family protein [Nocardioides sp. JQ2195]|nr:flp pilus-assembly TadE/G-like family protein [Nocardioides sp. JQ2195]